MKISELMIRDIRASIEIEDKIINIRNPKGEVKSELLQFFNEQIQLKGSEKPASNIEIIELLMKKLTNIEIDTDDIIFIFENPSHEMTRVILYLSSIMQELIFEAIATINLEVRMKENTILEKDTLDRLHNIEDVIKEIKHRRLLDDANRADDSEVVGELDGKEV